MKNQKLIIKSITKITTREQKELDKLKEKSKSARLTDKEANREFELGMKIFWNCEC